MFTKLVQESEPLAINSLIVIPVPKTCLIPVAECFKEVETDDTVAEQNGLTFSPKELMRALFTLMHVVYDPQLGCPLPDIGENSRSHCFINTNGETVDKVSVYVEFIYATDGEHLGWRIFIVCCDPNFNIDLGLSNFFEREAKRRAQDSRIYTKPSGASKAVFGISPYVTKETWVTSGINSYLGETMHQPVPNQPHRRAMQFPLNDPSNPASCRKVFSFERSLAHFPRAAPTHRDESVYLSEIEAPPAGFAENENDDEDEDEIAGLLNLNAGVNIQVEATRVSFPFGAYFVPHINRKPVVFFTFPVSRPPTAEELVMDWKTMRNMRRKVQEICDNMSLRDEVLEVAKAWVAKMTKDKSPAECREVFVSLEAEKLFQTICRKCTSMPGAQIAASWLLDKIHKNPGWYPCAKAASILDTKLSPFGNMIAAEIYKIELICGVLVLHVEMLLLMLMSLVVTDVDHDDMVFHLLLVGPPGSGKSFLHTILEKCSIPGLIYRLGSQSAKANTTGVNRNAHIALLDELNSLYTGKGVDGTGDSMLKELLTRGRSKDFICQVEDGEKKEVETNIEKKSMVIGNTNAERLPEAIGDRLYTRPVPVQVRLEVDAVLENHKMRTDPVRIAQLFAYGEKWRFMQSIAAMITLKTSGNLFKPVDMRLATKIASHVFKKLQLELGAEILIRDKARCMWLTKMLTIFEAIEEVWFSGRVVPPKTPFALSQVDLVVPYLTSTREHFLMALSMMDDVISDPSIPIIMEAIQSLIMNEPDEENRFGKNDNLKDRQEAAKPDYNYYAITIKCAGINESNNGVLNAICAMIENTIKTDTTTCYKASHIFIVLRRIMAQSRSVFPYIDATTLDDSISRRIPIIVIKRVGLNYSFEICRHYLQSIVVEKKDVLIDSVLSAVDVNFPVSKLVLGKSYRYGYKASANAKSQCFPFLLQTVDIEKHRHHAQPMFLEKDVYRRFAANILDGDDDEDDGEESSEEQDMQVDERMYRVQGNLEMEYLQSWCEMNGVPVPPPRDLSRRKATGHYPESFIEGYNKEFGNIMRSGAQPPKPSASKQAKESHVARMRQRREEERQRGKGGKGEKEGKEGKESEGESEGEEEEEPVRRDKRAKLSSQARTASGSRGSKATKRWVFGDEEDY